MLPPHCGCGGGSEPGRNHLHLLEKSHSPQQPKFQQWRLQKHQVSEALHPPAEGV